MGDDKIYLNPGDMVTLKLDIPNKPIMMVIKKEVAIFKDDTKKSILRGIKCRWFTTDGALQEAVFSTKDLIIIK